MGALRKLQNYSFTLCNFIERLIKPITELKIIKTNLNVKFSKVDSRQSVVVSDIQPQSGASRLRTSKADTGFDTGVCVQGPGIQLRKLTNSNPQGNSDVSSTKIKNINY